MNTFLQIMSIAGCTILPVSLWYNWRQHNRYKKRRYYG